VFVVSAVTAAQPATPDAKTIASIRELIHAGRIAQAEAQLKAFDVSSPLVSYLRGLARYHADDHPGAIELLASAGEVAARTDGALSRTPR
jgi:hypothetical protein